MANIISDMENKGVDLAHRIPEKAQKVGESFEKFTEKVENKIEDMSQQVREKTNTYLSNSRKYVKDHPIQSVAIAAASGMALGSLLSMIKANKHDTSMMRTNSKS